MTDPIAPDAEVERLRARVEQAQMWGARVAAAEIETCRERDDAQDRITRALAVMEIEGGAWADKARAILLGTD